VNTNLDGVLQAVLDALEASGRRHAPPPHPSPTRGEGGALPPPAAQRQRARGPLPPRGGGMGWGGAAISRTEDTP
jgi:hypothetical protein